MLTASENVLITAEDIKNLHRVLVQSVPESDEFWPRWVYFAGKKGIKL